MTNQQHPITPPEATVLSLRNSAPHGIGDFGATRELWLINHAYAAGADQELEACLMEVEQMFCWGSARDLRAARRPNPPSLKEQALAALARLKSGALCADRVTDESTIRRALEALPND